MGATITDNTFEFKGRVPITFGPSRSDKQVYELPHRFPSDQMEQVHRLVVGRLRTDSTIDQSNRGALVLLVREFVDLQGYTYNMPDRIAFAEQVVDEIVGYGPLEPLLADERITDISVNGPTDVFIMLQGMWRKVNLTFRNDEHLRHIIQRLVSASGTGRRVDDSSPMVDTRLQDGSRVNVVLPPVSPFPTISLRKFPKNRMTAHDLLRLNSATPWMLEFLQDAVRARLNIVISGGTGSGKTTLLGIIAQSIPNYEKIITIEDPRELLLTQDIVVPLETRPPNMEGAGEITVMSLVRNALRQNPDRIIVGEVRDASAFYMLRAMNSGHPGSMSTVHADDARQAVSTLMSLLQMDKDINVSEATGRYMISSSVQLIVQVSKFSTNGSRVITGISEIVPGGQGDMVSMQEIFSFRRTAVLPDGKVKGEFHGGGIVPRCAEKIAVTGKTYPPNFFEQKHEI